MYNYNNIIIINRNFILTESLMFDYDRGLPKHSNKQDFHIKRIHFNKSVLYSRLYTVQY